MNNIKKMYCSKLKEYFERNFTQKDIIDSITHNYIDATITLTRGYIKFSLLRDSLSLLDIEDNFEYPYFKTKDELVKLCNKLKNLLDELSNWHKN